MAGTLCRIFADGSFLFCFNRKAKPKRSDDFSQAAQGWVSIRSQHLIEVFPIQFPGSRNGRNLTRIQDIFERYKERRLRVLKRRLKVICGFRVVFEPTQQPVLIASGASAHVAPPGNPSNIFWLFQCPLSACSCRHPSRAKRFSDHPRQNKPGSQVQSRFLAPALLRQLSCSRRNFPARLDPGILEFAPVLSRRADLPASPRKDIFPMKFRRPSDPLGLLPRVPNSSTRTGRFNLQSVA